MSSDSAPQKKIELTTETAPALLRALLEKAQKGKAGLSLLDAATLHRAIDVLATKADDTQSENEDATEKTNNGALTPAAALKLCLEGVEKGQAAGVYTLEEAHNAVMIVMFLDRQLSASKEPEVDEKGKGKAE